MVEAELRDAVVFRALRDCVPVRSDKNKVLTPIIASPSESNGNPVAKSISPEDRDSALKRASDRERWIRTGVFEQNGDFLCNIQISGLYLMLEANSGQQR